MNIVEIFYSIQGEGKFAGRPSIFVRVGGCNLECKGFDIKGCDSYYAVDTKYKNSWQNKNIDEIISEIDDIIDNIGFEPDIVLTGGEPTLFYKDLYPIVERYKNITIETNSTVFIDFEKYPKYKDVVFAMSVKLSNSGEKYEKRVNKKAIKNIALNAKRSFFKFVVDDKDYKEEIFDIVGDLKNDIYCMPLGDTKDKLNKISQKVFLFCMENGFNYSDRIHIRIFNKKKGV